MSTQRRTWFGKVLWLGACVLLGGPAVALAHHGLGSVGTGSGPIYTISAATLGCGQWGADVRYEYLDFDQFSDTELLDFDAQGLHADSADFTAATFATVSYGVTDRLTVAAQLPYFHTSNIREVNNSLIPPEVESEGDPAGVGDLSLYAFYHLWSSCDDSLRVTLIGGLELPTGKTDARTAGGEIFEADHQPSSGSWDPLLGVACSKSYTRLSLHASTTYLFVNEGTQNAVLGDVWRYDVGAVYRLVGESGAHEEGEHAHGDDEAGHAGHVHAAGYHPEENGSGHAATWLDGHSGGHESCCERHFNLDAMLELNGISEGHDFLEGAVDESSGGNVIFLSPGLRFTWRERWNAYASVGIPVIQDQNPGVHRTESRYTVGLSGSF